MTLKKQFENVKPGDVGLIGDPVEHSLSPLIHNAAFKTWWAAFRDRDEPTPEYHRFHVKSDELEEMIRLMKSHRMRGLNVTVPHKIEAALRMDFLDPFAKRVGAINTISFSGAKISGFNTDAEGFKRALTWDLDFNPEGKKALVLGAGGTGRVITLALLDLLAERVFLWNRTPGRLDLLSLDGDRERVTPVTSALELAKVMQEVDLVVNATTVGLNSRDGLPAPGLKFNSRHVAFDVIYHHETTFLSEANKAGAKSSGGLGMLVYQGARSFEIWTGAPAPIEIMKSILSQHLKGG